MKRQLVGLVGAGKFADSPLFRALTLAGRLGPVKAPSVRVASRIVNRLRAGHPVSSYEDLEPCSLILISVPDPLLPGMVTELASQSIAWEGKAVVLCSGQLGSEELRELEMQGAHVGSLCAVPGFERHWILVEGSRSIEAKLVHLIDSRATRHTLIPPSRKAHYRAALACTGPLFAPILTAANDALKQAGVSASHASSIIEKQIERSTRSYFKAGRKANQDRSSARLAGCLDDILRGLR